MNDVLKPMKLTRKDGKVVDVIFYDNSDIKDVEILDIKKLKFEGTKVKDITKSDIRDCVFSSNETLYLHNKKSNITALLPRKHLTKIISTIFSRDTESRTSYMKKEIIANIGIIFYSAIPVLKHPELKSKILYDCQFVHRFAIPIKIGGLIFFVMITVKERTDYQKLSIEEFAIYDLYSENQTNEKSLGSSSTASVGINPMTTCSHYQATTYSINDLAKFVNLNVTKYQ